MALLQRGHCIVVTDMVFSLDRHLSERVALVDDEHYPFDAEIHSVTGTTEISRPFEVWRDRVPVAPVELDQCLAQRRLLVQKGDA